MDRPFDAADWQPTCPLEGHRRVAVDAKLPTLIANLAYQTKDVLIHPYNPLHWLQRSTTLLNLHYPELAVGDALKAQLLCETLLQRLETSDQYRLGHCMGFWMLDETKRDEDLEKQRDWIRDVQSCAHELGQRSLYTGRRTGPYIPRPYPLMAAAHRTRNDLLLETMNAEFAAQRRVDGKCMRQCIVQRNAFGVSPGSEDLLGVFATRDMQAGTEMFVERARTWGCIDPGEAGCRRNLSGDSGCTYHLHPNRPYIDSDPGYDLLWIRDRCGLRAALPIVRCRFLQCCIDDNVAHPLDHHLIARLTPTYHRTNVIEFDLAEDFAVMNEALQRCGIDIFANLAYDTWVLFTLDARISNNAWTTPISQSVSALFSLFNHSCEPNVNWLPSRDHHSLVLSTSREVKSGEQLFVTYDGYVESGGLKERRESLNRWFDGPCQCPRCLREEGEMAAAAAEGDLSRSGGGDDSNGAWDTGERPVLPEYDPSSDYYGW